MDFEKRYKQLNVAQRSAVDSIEGPVMVIAGPGTGKTELLGMRVANILKKTDTLPQNILCLTFTEAGSVAMQKRLTSIIGRDAYNVSIFTFHAFGSEIINKYREYFYNGANFRVADDLVRHRIITEILDSLEYNNPLRSKMNDEYTAISDILSALSDLKRAGLTDEEFRQLLDASQATVEIAGPLLSTVFAGRINKATRDTLAEILPRIESIDEQTPLASVASLSSVLSASIRRVIEEADSHEKVTPPITAWKKEWMASDVDKTQVLKLKKTLPKLRALNHIYSLYLQAMTRAEMIDYDDMIMQVVHAIEINDDLRYDLQEKYQYIMVDEFQDTNMAQMRILHNLTNNPVVEDTPNILVVGDDDQAIYGFQGAEIGNILNFKDIYPKTELITLTDNYRSTQPVLDSAREIIVQGNGRLEARVPEIDKTLTSHRTNEKTVTEIVNFKTPHDERKWVSSSIKDLIKSGTEPNQIAIIARKHADLISLLSYLTNDGIAISYDRRDDILENELIQQLVLIGTIVHSISVGKHEQTNVLLPQLLSHPAWDVSADVIWEISLTAYKNHEQWLQVMQKNNATKNIFDWLVATAKQSENLPLERIIDILIGHQAPEGAHKSPLKEYYFSDKKMLSDASDYISHLENLATIRQRLRDHATNIASPKLINFLDFIDDNKRANIRITSLRHIGEDNNAVQLLSAHGSKGLEFEHVFIINSTDNTWGEKARTQASVIAFPPHLRLQKNRGDYDERLRLFYVAMTRAKNGLHISYANENDANKEMLQAAFLLDSPLKAKENEKTIDDKPDWEAAEQLWYAPIVNIPSVTKREYLAPILASYKISATHVNSFVDVTNGGPQHFLLNTLLHFPSAPSANASYGTAIHGTLQQVHDHLRSTGSLQPHEDILQGFEKRMEKMPFTNTEREHYLQRGYDALDAFMKSSQSHFTQNQIAELDFSRQDVFINDAHLTGKLDVVEMNKETLDTTVIDYKTGGILPDWEKGNKFQKIKAYKYRQQLLFYKLLIENSRDWRKYTMNHGILQFVEPDPTGNIVDLSLSDIDTKELDRFSNLVCIIWQRIQDLSFPDTTNYNQSVEGIRQFEDDLLNGKI